MSLLRKNGPGASVAIRQYGRVARMLRRNEALPSSRTGPELRPCREFLECAGIDCVKRWSPVLVAALLAAAAAPAYADECSEFRNSVDAAIAADGYDGAVAAFSQAIDAWKVVQESNHWNSAADNLGPALVASKESTDAVSDARDQVIQLQTLLTSQEDRKPVEISIHSLDDLYHKTWIAFFELVFFTHCGDQPRS